MRHNRLRPRQSPEQDIVNRQADGSYLLGLLGEGHGMGVPGGMGLELQEEEKDRGMSNHKSVDVQKRSVDV